MGSVHELSPVLVLHQYGRPDFSSTTFSQSAEDVVTEAAVDDIEVDGFVVAEEEEEVSTPDVDAEVEARVDEPTAAMVSVFDFADTDTDELGCNPVGLSQERSCVLELK